jgi:uncharacterized membrane protein (DUF2068 family)
VSVEQALRNAARAQMRREFGLRVIILSKAIKAALLATVSVLAFAFHDSDFNLHALVVRVAEWFGIDLASSGDAFAPLASVTPVWIGVGAGIYALVLATQAWGLHRRWVWAEWLVVGVTAAVIPVEIYFLAIGPSRGKVFALVANVAIVLYLLRRRWLLKPRA